jgi:hypothetical protein
LAIQIELDRQVQYPEYRSEDKGPILSLLNLPGRMVFLVLGDSNDQYKRDT